VCTSQKNKPKKTSAIPLRTLLFLALLSSAALAEPLELSRQLASASAPGIELTPEIKSLPTLRKGSNGQAVARLSQWLDQAGAIVVPPKDPLVFGGEHELAVKRLQARLGLKEDGVAGPVLYANLGSSSSERQAGAERWAFRLEELAHQARSEGFRRMVVINIPTFTLRAIDLNSGKTVVHSAVVVGRPDRPTPIGRMNIVGLKYNPEWTPPEVVLKKDILPRLGKDAVWFDRHGLVATGPDGVQKNASEIGAEEFSSQWKIFQPAGKTNALGRLKFETDSPTNIYLHDTNDHALFANTSRARSSGCIRVERWAELAAFIADRPRDVIDRKVEQGNTVRERVQKTPVFIEYSLADIVASGDDLKTVVFPDIYALPASPTAGNANK